jgi:hypothetical protein
VARATLETVGAVLGAAALSLCALKGAAHAALRALHRTAKALRALRARGRRGARGSFADVGRADHRVGDAVRGHQRVELARRALDALVVADVVRAIVAGPERPRVARAVVKAEETCATHAPVATLTGARRAVHEKRRARTVHALAAARALNEAMAAGLAERWALLAGALVEVRVGCRRAIGDALEGLVAIGRVAFGKDGAWRSDIASRGSADARRAR